MGKFVILFLLCAFVAICYADEVKKENTLDELQATIEARLKEVKQYIDDHVDRAKLQDFVDKLTENSKKFVTETQAEFEKLGAKKEE